MQWCSMPWVAQHDGTNPPGVSTACACLPLWLNIPSQGLTPARSRKYTDPSLSQKPQDGEQGRGVAMKGSLPQGLSDSGSWPSGLWTSRLLD